MKTKCLIFLGLMCICFTVNAQLTIPKKKCTRGKCYFVDQTGKRISNYYEDVKKFNEALGAVQLDGKWGFVNDTMEIIIPLAYEKVTSFKDGLSAVKQDSQFYLIDKNGVAQSEKYDSINYIHKYILVKKGNKYGLLNEKGAVVETVRFEQVSAFYKNDFGVKLDGKWANYNNGNLNFDDPTIYYNTPEQMPLFGKQCLNSEDMDARNACSNKEMLNKVYQSIRYPREARGKAIQGTVVIRFLINKSGMMEDAEIVNNVGGNCGEEALGVVKTYLRKWAKAGMENNESVNTIIHLPVKFKLD